MSLVSISRVRLTSLVLAPRANRPPSCRHILSHSAAAVFITRRPRSSAQRGESVTRNVGLD
jgi:hypothetical protein